MLVEARHPVLECLDSQPYQPNDTYLALNSSLHIITGGCREGQGLPQCCCSAAAGCSKAQAQAVLPPVLRSLSLPS